MRLLVLLALLPACAATHPSVRPDWSGCISRAIERNLVLCDDQPFVELECLGGGDAGCKAVRVRTVRPPANRIYCAPGFKLDKPLDAANRKAIKFDLQLSPDQTQVWFSGGDLFNRAWHAYSPSSEVLGLPDGEGQWLQRELMPDDARSLCGAAH